jgi:hypothetical protein
MKRLFLLPMLTLALYAADLTGTWTGTVDVSDPSNGDKISTPVKAELKQAADAVTGKIGRTQDQNLESIRDGKLEGKVLTFNVLPEEATKPMKFTLTLVTDNRIEGDMVGEIDVGKIQGKVVLTRGK